MTSLSTLEKKATRLLGRRVRYHYLNKGKALTGRITTVSSCRGKLISVSVLFDGECVAITRSWKSFSLID